MFGNWVLFSKNFANTADQITLDRFEIDLSAVYPSTIIARLVFVSSANLEIKMIPNHIVNELKRYRLVLIALCAAFYMVLVGACIYVFKPQSRTKVQTNKDVS